MTDRGKATDAVPAARIKAIEEATAEAQRIAREWRTEAERTHSHHHSDLLRTWTDAAEKVASAIAALAPSAEADDSGSTMKPRKGSS